MHEFSLCQGLVSALYKQPINKGKRELYAIEVTVGPLAGVEPELLAHAFPLAVKGTPFNHVEMRIEHSDITVQCHDCKKISIAIINDLRCKHCMGEITTVLSGAECALTHLYYGEREHV